jgi:tRNA A37 methylthiotransferase MiaB
MNRKHTIEDYYEIILEKLKKAKQPGIQVLKSDFIIGYPRRDQKK